MFHDYLFVANLFVDNLFPDPPAGGGTPTLRIKPHPGSAYPQLFSDGDIIRLKSWTTNAILDTWLEVTDNGTVGADYIEYTTAFKAGSQGTFPAGCAVINYGTAGEGFMFLRNDHQAGPFLQIGTHGGEPWTYGGTAGQSDHFRSGRLRGVLGLTEDEWGLAVSADLADADEPYVILSNKRLELSGVTQTWSVPGPTGRVTRGALNPAASDTDVMFWLGGTAAAPGLAVLGDGTMTISQSVLIGEAADLFFTQNSGRLLLGPYSPLTSSSWTSTRGHAAAITGGFRTGPGRWAGTRALVVMCDKDNYIKNPRFQVNVTDYWTVANGTRSQVTTRPRWGDYCCQLTASASNNPYLYHDHTDLTLDVGTDYVLSAYFRTDDADSIGRSALVRITETGGAADASTSAYVTLTSDWQRVAVQHTMVHADSTTIRIIVRGFVDDGDTLYVDGVMLTKTDYLLPYHDGGVMGCAWDATADNDESSPSGDTVVSLDSHVDAVNGEDQVSIRAVVQMPANYNQTDSADPVTIWDMANSAAGTPDNTRLALRYYYNTQQFKLYAQGATRLTTTAGAYEFKAGDWLDLVLVIDFPDRQSLYIGGELAASGTVSLGELAVDKWKVGGAYSTGSAPRGIAVGEFAVFARSLTAAQVAALYGRQLPLVDLAPSQTPGLYIYDGQFEMRSTQDNQDTLIINNDGIAFMRPATQNDYNAYKFIDSSGNVESGYYCYGSSSSVSSVIDVDGATGDRDAQFTLNVDSDSATRSATITLSAENVGAARLAAFTAKADNTSAYCAASPGMRVYEGLIVGDTLTAGPPTGTIAIKDAVADPDAIPGFAIIYVDDDDGDLKVRFGDGTVKTIVTDT